MELEDRKIYALAKMCHDVNKSFCEVCGDDSQKSWDEAPQHARDSAVNGVKAFLENPNMTAKDSHDAWAKEKRDNGWVYGKTKDSEKKTHPDLVPYEELNAEQKFKDALFRNTVKTYLDFVGDDAE